MERTILQHEWAEYNLEVQHTMRFFGDIIFCLLIGAVTSLWYWLHYTFDEYGDEAEDPAQAMRDHVNRDVQPPTENISTYHTETFDLTVKRSTGVGPPEMEQTWSKQILSL